MLALIDADIIVYEASTFGGKGNPFDGVVRKDFTVIEAMRDRIMKDLERIIDATSADNLLLIFSPDSRSNFRKMVSSDYKKSRPGVSGKPWAYWQLVAWCRDTYPCLDYEGIEGDDLLGLLQTKNLEQGLSDTVVVSSDKDLRTIPGWLYDHKKENLIKITENMANYWWMTQTLIGDPTDGYTGIPGIGPKKAERILPPLTLDEDPAVFFHRLWTEVCFAYLEYFEDDVPRASAEAIRQARLARILRSGDFDFETEAILLWRPDGGDWLPQELVINHGRNLQ